MSTTTEADRLPRVTDWGDQIQRRRVTLGMSVSSLAKRAGVDRATLQRVEDGEDSVRDTTLAAISRALDELEVEMGMEDGAGASESQPIRITFHDVSTSSIGEIIVEGPSDQPDELIATITRLLAEVRKGGDA